MPYLFTPPTIRYPVGNDPLWSRVFYDVGTSLVKKSGFYTQVQFPDSETLAAADLFYLGGHVYLISDQEAADLTAAGYADFLATPPITPTPGPVGGYGRGRYGVGSYGDGDPEPPAHLPYGAGPYGEGVYE